MGAENLINNISWVGVKDPGLRVFDIIMKTEKGTTYNSYIIDDEKVVLLDIVKAGFYTEFKSNIKEVIGDKKIDYIVVHHTELDHSGALINLISDYPEAIVLGTRATLTYLKNILNRDFNGQEAKGELSIGSNTLSFISAPNLHWPDTMFTYVKEQSVLFTCDFTGSHYCPEGSIKEKHSEVYYKEMEYYFECIMGPFKRFVNNGLDKIKDLKIDMILPSHGPVHTDEISKVISLYSTWAKETVVEKDRVEIFYISAYHNTELMANYFKDRLIEKGFKAEVTEILDDNLEDCVKRIEGSKGFLIGSPTINQDAVKPAWDLLSLVNPIVNRGKAAMAFGSYGWSGEAVPMLTDRLASLKLKVVNPGCKFCFVPSEDKLKEANCYLDKFIELMK